MKGDAAFWILRAYSSIWMGSKSRVIVEGRENLPTDPTRRRTYIVINHSTTFDLVALMHISGRRFSVVMDEGAFNFPVVRRLFVSAGFIPLVKSRSAEAVDAAVRKIREGTPVVMSLTDGGSAVGREERPRTGGVRIAHLADAAIYPVFTMVEENRKRHLSFKGVNGEKYPYTTFRDTLYFVSFLPPIPASAFAESETYESYGEVARQLREMADREQQRIERLLVDQKARFDSLPRRGGTSVRVLW
jgi:1-acyl-sn-glycerol-3-phosphate acyltransferase